MSPTHRGVRTNSKALDWRDAADIERVREALHRRTVYTDAGGPVELVQTHISSVFLTPQYVFKFKRPVDLGFVDFSTLKQRRHFCYEERRLNERLAPGVYLEVLPLWTQEGRLQFERGERIVDYCVVMRHLPPEDMMDRRLAAGRVSTAEIEALARLLVSFHKARRPRREIAAYGSLEMLATNWEENFQQTQRYVNSMLPSELFDEMQRGVAHFLSRNRALLQRRMDGGFIRDGHGDLRCEHVYLGEEIKVIDCVEFNERFRFADVANDLAFLLMDLTVQGHPELARELMERYIAHSGDRELRRLVAFYCSYRAWVRGKVLGFKLGDSSSLGKGEQHALLTRARRFFRLARAFARQMQPPVLIVMTGLIGTGKSSVAEALAEQTGARMLSSDRIRKELAAAEGLLEPAHTREADFAGGIYTPEWNRRTYDELFRRAEAALQEGHSVILDATFSRVAQRQQAFGLARTWEAEPCVVECRLAEPELLRRLEQRAASGAALSDGRAGLYGPMKSRYEPVVEVPPERHVVVDTAQPAPQAAREVLERRAFTVPPPLFSMPPEDGDAE